MADQRRNQLAMIHIARTQLGMDDETYRDMLHNVGGERSSAKLNADGRQKVLEHLRSLGAAFKRKRDPGTVRTGRNALVGKIEAQLADMKLAWSYADAIVERMHGLSSVRFANVAQLRDVVAALTVEQEKRGLNTSVDECLAQLGWSRDSLQERFPELPSCWHRRRRALRQLIAALDQRISDQPGGEQ